MDRRRIAGAALAGLALAGHAGTASAEEAPTTAQETVLAGILSDEWESAADLNGLGAATGKRVTFAGTFHTVGESAAPNWDGTTHWILEQAWQGKATPIANVDIPATAASIARGDHDAAIRAWAGHVKGWLDLGEGRSLLVAPMQEMNGDWVPYGVDPAAYRKAYRRFVTIFDELGMDATQVRWVFAPNGWSTPPYRIADYYPGHDVVDFIGLSAYNWGATLGGWTSAAETIGAAIDEVRGFAPRKPYLLTQVGSSTDGGDRDAWLVELFRVSAADAHVVGIVYFNFDKETDWEIWDGSTVAQGWIDGMALETTRYVWPLTGWFAGGELPISVPVPASRFSDTVDSLFWGDIEWLAARGVTAGCEAGLYCGSDVVTREQMATFLMRALDLPESQTDWFDDDNGSYHEAHVNALAEAGVTMGCGERQFCATQPVSRQEMATFLVRGFQLKASSIDRFGDDEGSYHEAHIDSIAQVGITIGCDVGLFCPLDAVNREQMAGFLRRAMDRR